MLKAYVVVTTNLIKLFDLSCSQCNLICIGIYVMYQRSKGSSVISDANLEGFFNNVIKLRLRFTLRKSSKQLKCSR